MLVISCFTKTQIQI